MTWHDAIGINFQAFMLLAIFQAVHKNDPMTIFYKQIYPIDNCKRDKVNFTILPYLVIAALAAR